MGGDPNSQPKPSLEIQVASIVIRDSFNYRSKTSGAVFHKVKDPAEATRMARLLVQSAKAYRLPLPFFLAVIAQESRFDPGVINWNGYPGVVTKGDYGIAQRSGAVMVSQAKKLKVRVQTLIDQALDPSWAIPWAAREYRSLIDWAEENAPRQDKLLVATLAYNRGKSGALDFLAGTAPPENMAKGRKHMSAVLKWHRKYLTELPPGA